MANPKGFYLDSSIKPKSTNEPYGEGEQSSWSALTDKSLSKADAACIRIMTHIQKGGRFATTENPIDRVFDALMARGDNVSIGMLEAFIAYVGERVTHPVLVRRLARLREAGDQTPLGAALKTERVPSKKTGKRPATKRPRPSGTRTVKDFHALATVLTEAPT